MNPKIVCGIRQIKITRTKHEEKGVRKGYLDIRKTRRKLFVSYQIKLVFFVLEYGADVFNKTSIRNRALCKIFPCMTFYI